jgi:hypothetical protein
MKPLGTVLRCSFFMIVLLSCQQEQENLTSINQENAYIFGVWKAPTAKSAKEVIANVSAKIHAHAKIQPSPIVESQQQKNAKLKDSESKHFTESETVYEPLPYSTTAAPETLLPRDGEVINWVRSRKPTTYNSETLYEDRFMFLETYPEIFRNYGFQKQAEVEYQNSKFGSVPYILLEIFDMGTPENAFGIFSVHSHPKPKYEWIGCKAIISGKYLRFWKGKYFVQIEGYRIATGIRNGMIALARVTAKRIQDPPQKIPLLELLPTQHIRGSEKLFYTNWALREVYKSAPNIIPQLADKTIGVLAQYKDPRSKKTTDSYIVFVLRFPNVAEAHSAYTQYSNALMSEKVSFETDSQSGAILINEQFAEP